VFVVLSTNHSGSATTVDVYPGSPGIVRNSGQMFVHVTHSPDLHRVTFIPPRDELIVEDAWHGVLLERKYAKAQFQYRRTRVNCRRADVSLGR
jgi:hypothetical protein